MVTAQTLMDLREFVQQNATDPRREELLGALEGLQQTIAAQALVVRNLTGELRNRRIGQEAMEAIVPAGAIDALAGRLGMPRETTFSLTEAQAACAALVDEAAGAKSIVEIAAAVARVVRVFV
jgi:CxxC motif-containing protein (DUF1111 family)